MAKSDKDDTQSRLEKLRKKIPHDWEDLDSLSEQALGAKVLEATEGLIDNQKIREEDEELETAVEKAKRLALPYNDAKKRLTAITQYCSLRLRELGK